MIINKSVEIKQPSQGFRMEPIPRAVCRDRCLVRLLSDAISNSKCTAGSQKAKPGFGGKAPLAVQAGVMVVMVLREMVSHCSNKLFNRQGLNGFHDAIF